jgi:hypothetical protein
MLLFFLCITVRVDSHGLTGSGFMSPQILSNFSFFFDNIYEQLAKELSSVPTYLKTILFDVIFLLIKKSEI